MSEPLFTITIPLIEASGQGWDLEGVLDEFDCEKEINPQTNKLLPVDHQEWKFIVTLCPYGGDPYSEYYLEGPLGKSRLWGEEINSACDLLFGYDSNVILFNFTDFEEYLKEFCKYPFRIEE